MKVIFALVSFAAVAVAQDVSNIPSGSDCASNSYSADQIQAAAQEALQLWGNNQEAGDYPHTYNDYEGFSFDCGSPYIEYPIKESGVYTGGSPGADRVVIGSPASDGSSGQYCALITHTGASGNNFEECSDE